MRLNWAIIYLTNRGLGLPGSAFTVFELHVARKVAYREGEFLRLLALHADRDSAYG